MYFGGLPFSTKKVPIIKTIEKYPKVNKVKRFTLNAFLDMYLNENQPPKTSYEKFIEEKKKEEEQIQIEKQKKLKEYLHIRTFDEIQ